MTSYYRSIPARARTPRVRHFSIQGYVGRTACGRFWIGAGYRPLLAVELHPAGVTCKACLRAIDANLRSKV